MPLQPARNMASALHPGQSSYARPSGDVASFSSSFSAPLQQQQQHHPYAHASHPSQDSMSHGSYRGSFGGEVVARRPTAAEHDQVIYTASYSGVAVYEMEVNGVAVMRRRVDSWLNATQILKVAGIDKGRRTKILEKEILTGQHEKIQGGYGRYQGTWISYQRGREFCRQYGVEDILRPLLDYDIGSDGTGNTAHADTPTKEQAMAANRKKFFSSSIDSRINGHGNSSTFFQNISPTASNALAAMHKAARYESPLPRPGSAQKRPAGILRRQSSQQHAFSQDSAYPGGSQQSVRSFKSDQHPSNSAQQDQIYGQSQNGYPDVRQQSTQEPPRKKARISMGQDPYLDPMTIEETPTEPNDSFMQPSSQHFARDSDQGPLALPMLPTPEDGVEEERRRVLLNVLSDNSRTDSASHTAIANYSGQDLDIPLDARGNTALHWAALLGNIKIMRALINKGANIFRGNAGGETPLMHAVSVNNTFENNYFSEMLEYLGPLIEVRDAIGRTVLHHIAVASGIKGRAQSSRYYLESLLEYTVRQGSSSAVNSQSSSFAEKPQPATANLKSKPMSLSRFMNDVVNIQDKCGNTALNLVSRIGSHVIINQLEEIGADFSIPNHKGFRPESFGIFPKNHVGGSQQLSDGASQGLTQTSTGETKSNSQIDQIKEEIFATTQSILAQTQSHYTTEMTRLSNLHDTQTNNLRALATEHANLNSTLASLKARARNRKERARRLKNLRRVRETLRQKRATQKRKPEDLDFDLSIDLNLDDPSSLPSTERLVALLNAHSRNNEALSARLQELKSAQTSSDELEVTYRKVVALCTGVAEEEVESLLPQLLRAVEGGEAAAVAAA